MPSDLIYLVVPDGTEVICKQCYKEKAIKRVLIPKCVREIQEGAFEDCKNLREVIFEEGSMLKQIECGAFQNCGYLRNILLPDGLEEIGLNAFCGSGLVSIAFPSSLRTVR